MIPLSLKKRVLVLCCISVILGIASIHESWAGKPGGGSATPVGRIFYGGETHDWSMKADGTDKQLTAYQRTPDSRTEFLSYRLHGGHHWYLEIRWNADSPCDHSLFAVRDDGDPNYTVLLLNAVDVDGNLTWLDSIRWGQDDSFISFTALATVELPDGSVDYDPNGLHTLYSADVVFDESGRPALAVPPKAILTGEIAGERDIAWYDWSPDGSEVVYDLDNVPGFGLYSLIVADLLTGQSRLLADDAIEPAWSPDGSRIVFRTLYSGGIKTIRPDGSGEFALTKSGFAPVWSPDGKYIAFTVSPIRSSTYDVNRISADGGTVVNLTKDINTSAGVLPGFGWR